MSGEPMKSRTQPCSKSPIPQRNRRANMSMPHAEKKRGIVIGGSVAGHLASRVLSDHFEQVSLIERDVLPTQVQQRRGVPQGCHTHGLLASGRNDLERLFPGISEPLV